MISLEEARTFVLSSCTTLEPWERPVDSALGHVTARAVVAQFSLPPFANSGMDGYALRAADTQEAPVRLQVTGTLMAGDHTTTELAPGEAMRIMTGAPLPPGADAVCMVEHTHLEGDRVVIEEILAKGSNVRPAGDDVSPGDEVIAAGTELSAGHLGMLAALGIDTVRVFRRPRVGVVSTGDELFDAAGPLPPGRIRDANRHTLLALASEEGDAVDLGIVPDDETKLAEVLRGGAEGCDALVTSGGVSVGDRDVVKVVLDELSGGTMRWMQVAIKPAKPFAFGLLGANGAGVPVFGLPGNPVSAMVSFELFARPALRLLAGHRRLDRPLLRATARVALDRPLDGKLHLVRVRASTSGDGALEVVPAGGQGSHQLRAMADANALALVPDGHGVAAGDAVDVLLLDANRVDTSARTDVDWLR